MKSSKLFTRISLWLAGIIFVSSVGAATGVLPIWLLDNQFLYQVDSDKVELRHALEVPNGSVVNADASGQAWVLTGDHLQRWENRMASTPMLVHSIPLSTLGMAASTKILRTDPSDGSAWLSDGAYIWHIGVDGKSIGAPMLLEEPLSDISVGWDKTLWLLGNKYLRQIERPESGARSIHEIPFNGLPDLPARIALDPLHQAVWFAGAKWLSRVDLAGVEPRLDIPAPADLKGLSVEPQKGTLWLLTSSDLSAYRVDGSRQAVISLKSHRIQGAKQFAIDPTGRYLWVTHAQGISRVDSSVAGGVVVAGPKLPRLQAVGVPLFSATPLLSLVAPKPSEKVASGTTFTLEADTVCQSGACALPPEYYGSLDVRATVNGDSLGVILIDPDTRRASATLHELPVNKGKLQVEAVATDAFGRTSAPVSVRLTVKDQPQPAETSAPNSVNAAVAPISPQVAASAAVKKITAGDINRIFTRLPLTFEANQGQQGSEVDYVSRGRGYHLFLTKGETVLSLHRGKRSEIEATRQGDDRRSRFSKMRRGGQDRKMERAPDDVVRVSFPGAKPRPQAVPEGKLVTQSHYLTSPDKSKWRTNVPNYERVRYLDVYPGMDQVFYGKGGNLEFDWIVKPGADPKVIRQRFKGAKSLALNGQGDLVISLTGGVVTQHKPVVYQDVDGVRKAIDGRYILMAGNQVRFDIGNYDRDRDLVIDPVLSYATYLGGESGGYITGIAVDQTGALYVTGMAQASDFPLAEGSTAPVPYFNDAYVAKIDPKGERLVYTSFFRTGYYYYTPPEDGVWRNFNQGEIRTIAVDAQGQAYIAGRAHNAFPTTAGSAQPTATVFPAGNCESCSGMGHGFIAKLNAEGDGLIYSTFLDGDYPKSGNADTNIGVGSTINALALGADGSVYVAGETTSANFPVTTGAYQTTKPSPVGCLSGFVTKLNPSGSAWVYSSYLGSSRQTDCSTEVGGGDRANDVVVDAGGHAYVVGETNQNFPVTSNAYQTSVPGLLAGFVSKISPNGASLMSSTLLGGSVGEAISGVGLDAANNLYVTGFTASSDFPTVNAYQSIKKMPGQMPSSFITKLDLTQSGSQQLIYSTYFSGSGSTQAGAIRGEFAGAIAVEPNGTATIVGATASPDFPVKDPAIPSGGFSDFEQAPYVARFNANGELLYSMPLALDKAGEESYSWPAATAVAVDGTGAAYVAGHDGIYTSSGVLQPETVNPNGNSFIIKIAAGGAARLSLAAYPNPSYQDQTLNLVINLAGAGSPATGTWSWCDGTNCTALPALSAAEQISNTTRVVPVTLSVGTHTLTARYSGDSATPLLVSSPWVQTIYAARGNTSLTLTPSSTVGVVGQPMDFTATLNRANMTCGGQAVQAGTVDIFDGNGNRLVDQGSTDAPIAVSTPYDGLQTFKAIYKGDQCNKPATSNVVSLNVEASSPPIVLVASPITGAKFQTGTSIPLFAQVRVGTGRTVNRVEFSIDGVLLGTVTTAPYSLVWNPTDPASGLPVGVSPGHYTFTVRAWDNRGESGTSIATVIDVVAGNKPGETNTFLHNDVTGSPVAATNDSGVVLWKEGYRPYGEKTKSQTASANNRQFFHGKPLDAATGLQFFGARYYDPVIGRFMGTDPKGFTDGDWHSFNRYAFANNNPYRYTDPDGNTPIDIGFLGVDVVKLGFALYSGNRAEITESVVDVGISAASLFSPIPGAGQVYKVTRATKKAADIARTAGHAAEEARMVEKAAKGVGAAAKESDNVIHVTSKGVALPPDPKYKIPDHYVQNPNPKVSGNYGEIVNGKYRERLAIHPDHGTGRGSHYHLGGTGSTHNSPRPGDPDPGFTTP